MVVGLGGYHLSNTVHERIPLLHTIHLCYYTKNKYVPVQKTIILYTVLQCRMMIRKQHNSKQDWKSGTGCGIGGIVELLWIKDRLQHAATHCNTLQRTATHSYTLQHTASHCDTLRHTATLDIVDRVSTLRLEYDGIFVAEPAVRGNTLQHNVHTATHRNTLQHAATHCNTLQHTVTRCNTLQHTATHCNTLQHAAAHCNTLQHAAIQCSRLQHTATHCVSPILPTRPASMFECKYTYTYI